MRCWPVITYMRLFTVSNHQRNDAWCAPTPMINQQLCHFQPPTGALSYWMVTICRTQPTALTADGPKKNPKCLVKKMLKNLFSPTNALKMWPKLGVGVPLFLWNDELGGDDELVGVPRWTSARCRIPIPESIGTSSTTQPRSIGAATATSPAVASLANQIWFFASNHWCFVWIVSKNDNNNHHNHR